MNSDISVPLWSLWVECQVVAFALTSPVMIDVPRVSMWARVFMMSVFSVAWLW